MGARSSTEAAGAKPRRHHLATVADAFLSGDAGRRAGRAGAATAPPAARPLYTAAPGAVDTARILARLAPRRSRTGAHDLGGSVGERLARWEREDSLTADAAAAPLLLWGPRGDEGLSVRAGLSLGRLAALLRPRRVTVLWQPGSGTAPVQRPAAAQRARAAALVAAAVPGATVTVHCLGWDAPADAQLDQLAARFA